MVGQGIPIKPFDESISSITNKIRSSTAQGSDLLASTGKSMKDDYADFIISRCSTTTHG